MTYDEHLDRIVNVGCTRMDIARVDDLAKQLAREHARALASGEPCDPADAVCALMIAHLLRATTQDSWHHLRSLWHRVWITYLQERPDGELFAVAPASFARRAFASGHPIAIRVASRALAEGWLDPMSADDAFAALADEENEPDHRRVERDAQLGVG